MEQVLDWYNNNQTQINDYLINFVTAVLIFWIGGKIARYVGSLSNRMLQARGIDTAVASFVASLVNAVIFAAVIIAALSQVGIETATFVAILGAAGLAIGLSLQGSLSNFASGILITVFRPFKAGDFVEAGGVSGVVKEIQIFSTILTTPDNKYVVLPNAQVTGGAITNYSRHETRRLDLVVGVSYAADLQKTEEVLKSVLDKHELILPEPDKLVAVGALADSSVNFNVRAWVKTADYWTVYFDLNKSIKLELDKNGIEIPFPQMDVHLHKDNA
ncbi:mechanosensitive channel protein [Catenovulum agarivorans DS-2]|uniref:Small-conductance mechanosensitive channel n=1 Tax=Catenovulum agarivorans DS-2 TaxID=1328313 RepID=W7QIB6_9ALTE|nr:mechanosensitive ion channel domain-containing protein [Catenovulum agarivorans]EWH11586.1 mechanosensitive channel protein [Catenovulum agarivorans DS-2]